MGAREVEVVGELGLLEEERMGGGGGEKMR